MENTTTVSGSYSTRTLWPDVHLTDALVGTSSESIRKAIEFIRTDVDHSLGEENFRAWSEAETTLWAILHIRNQTA